MMLIATGVRKAGNVRFLRFLAAGFVNTLFGYLVYLFGLLAGLTPELALLVATAVGAIFNYFTTARFVFAYRTLGRLPVFVAAYSLTYAINAGAIRLLLDRGVSPAAAQALLVPAMAVLSFAIFRTVVFRGGDGQ